MHRTQLLLEEWQYEELKAMAEQTGRSMSDVLRGLITAQLGPRRSRSKGVADLAGMVKDGPSDLGTNHDHYLYGAPKRRR
jgi:hypothetical protein